MSAAKTREECRKLKLEEKKKADTASVRRIPFWLRFAIFTALIFISVTAGALVGYCGLGHGRAIDVFRESTWVHIYDLVEKN